MKYRVRLSPEEALHIGLDVIPRSDGGNAKYRITQEQREEVLRYRHKGLAQHCESRGIDINAVSQYWDKTKGYSVQVRPNVVAMHDLAEDILEDMKAHVPKYKKINREPSDEPHMLLIDPADIHIGKLASSFEVGEDYNNEIAVKRVYEGVEGILQKAWGFDINQIALVIGNDILHVDTPRRTTTSGTPQDTDGMWYDNFRKAVQVYVDVIETLRQVAPVYVTYNPSNHDYTHGFFLAQVVSTWFREADDVKMDVSIAHRKYMMYGKNMIGTTHGDGAKQNDLPLLMATEQPEYWAKTKYRYIYTHHVHHKQAKEFPGVTVESLRSPSGTDSWHHRNGYQGALKAIEGYIHHPEHGQIARLSHYF